MSKGKGRTFRRKAVTAALIAGAFAVSSVAFAAWTSGGIGFGRSKAGAMQSLTITPKNVTVAGQLYPDAFGDISATVTNPNTQFAVVIDSITATGPFTYDNGSDATACALQVSASDLTNGFVGQTIPAGGSLDIDAANAAYMGPAAANSCQNGVFKVALSLTASSA